MYLLDAPNTKEGELEKVIILQQLVDTSNLVDFTADREVPSPMKLST